MIVEFIQAYPRGSIVIISILVSLFITLVNFFVMDKDRMRELRARQKEINAQIKLQKDPVKQRELTNELFKHTGESMKHSFKPMLITLVPVLIVFALVKGVYADTSLGSSWFWYYFVTAIISSIIFRKIFKLP